MNPRIASLLLVLALTGADIASSEGLRGSHREIQEIPDEGLSDQEESLSTVDVSSTRGLSDPEEGPSAVDVSVTSTAKSNATVAPHSDATPSPHTDAPAVVTVSPSVPDTPVETKAPVVVTPAPTNKTIATEAPDVVTPAPTKATTPTKATEAPVVEHNNPHVNNVTSAPVGANATRPNATQAPSDISVFEPTDEPKRAADIATEGPSSAVPLASSVEVPDAPVASPVAPPVAAPVAAPVEAPVAAPVEAPVAAPVESPTAEQDSAPTFQIHSSIKLEFFEDQAHNPSETEIQLLTAKAKDAYQSQLKTCFPNHYQNAKDVGLSKSYDSTSRVLDLAFTINVQLAQGHGSTEHDVAKCISGSNWKSYISKLPESGIWSVHKVAYEATGKGR